MARGMKPNLLQMHSCVSGRRAAYKQSCAGGLIRLGCSLKVRMDLRRTSIILPGHFGCFLSALRQANYKVSDTWMQPRRLSVKFGMHFSLSHLLKGGLPTSRRLITNLA